MSDYTVTLRFGDEFLDVECDTVQVATDAEDTAVAVPEAANDVPPGYVRLEIAEQWDLSHGMGPALVGDGNMALVSDEHVAMIQRED
ncbi:hypothetical protein [Halosimplex pelagicum]|uniref:Uncharacterized protein n=1 Tax=Halosimplex pelagicum TaxID=869886 RepID=A0A7D5TA28_9EURY|nr:hypothetical protein [Halosimplex pelagicum]QLH80973.1 hypothetical protein HZS54_04680 [Halosimplex pelagicum]